MSMGWGSAPRLVEQAEPVRLVWYSEAALGALHPCMSWRCQACPPGLPLEQHLHWCTSGAMLFTPRKLTAGPLMSVLAAYTDLSRQLCRSLCPAWCRLEDPQNKQRRDDFYANVGDAIRTLREETPLLFQQELTCERAEQFAASMRGPGRCLEGSCRHLGTVSQQAVGGVCCRWQG